MFIIFAWIETSLVVPKAFKWLNKIFYCKFLAFAQPNNSTANSSTFLFQKLYATICFFTDNPNTTQTIGSDGVSYCK